MAQEIETMAKAGKQEEKKGGSLDAFLKGFVPEKISDDFEVLKGQYEVVVTEAKFEHVEFDNGGSVDRFSINTRVTEVLKGDGAPGRFLRFRFNADEKGVKKLLDSLFTADLLSAVKTSSEAALKASIGNLKDKTMYVKAWGWTPDKEQDGTPIAEEDRKTRQQVQVIAEKGGGAQAKPKGKKLF